LLNVRCLEKRCWEQQKFTSSLVFLEKPLAIRATNLLNVSSHVHLYIL
jgi:hypothetical protein